MFDLLLAAWSTYCMTEKLSSQTRICPEWAALYSVFFNIRSFILSSITSCCLTILEQLSLAHSLLFCKQVDFCYSYFYYALRSRQTAQPVNDKFPIFVHLPVMPIITRHLQQKKVKKIKQNLTTFCTKFFFLLLLHCYKIKGIYKNLQYWIKFQLIWHLQGVYLKRNVNIW